MSSFCVFGMTALVARAMAEDEIGWYTGAGVNRRELTREERAALVDARAAELFEKRKTRQISPAFDAPQFAREWLDIAHRSTTVRGGVSHGPRAQGGRQGHHRHQQDHRDAGHHLATVRGGTPCVTKSL